MSTRAFVYIFIALLSVSRSAIAQKPRAVVTAAAAGESLRFAAPSSACQIRLQVLSAAGDTLSDSGWRDGNVLDWPSSAAAQTANGSYRCLLSIRELDGSVSEREVVLEANAEPAEARTITLLAHDGANGSVVSTSGDLAFRFGDFLHAADTERMRLTASGRLGIGTSAPETPLDVRGLIRTDEGVMFPDGTILTSAAGLPGRRIAADSAPGGTVRRAIDASNSLAPVSGSRPRPAVRGTSGSGPSYQFVADATGVHIGTSSAYGLDVAGDVWLGANLYLGPSSTASGGVIYADASTLLHHAGDRNMFLGVEAGNLLTTAALNVGVGENALHANTTGSRNVGVGAGALDANINAWNNVAVGVDALGANTNGGSNTAVGSAALGNNGSGASNTALGDSALASNTTATGNTALGTTALGANNGAWNTAVGFEALAANITGQYNIALGERAGLALTTGCCNIDIGNWGVAGEERTIRIGSADNQARAFIAGIRGVTTGSASAIPVLIDSNGQLGTASSSRRSKFDIADMNDATAALMRLRPVTFRYRAHGADAPRQYGLIAEEVAEVYPELVARSQDGEVETVMYQFLAPMLLNEVQRQQREIESLRAALDEVTRRLGKMEFSRRQ